MMVYAQAKTAGLNMHVFIQTRALSTGQKNLGLVQFGGRMGCNLPQQTEESHISTKIKFLNNHIIVNTC